jgi:YHS domain-containing protein
VIYIRRVYSPFCEWVIFSGSRRLEGRSNESNTNEVMEMRSRMISTACLALVVATLIALSVRAETPSDVNTIDGIALHGFDPVAYFTQNNAVKGDAQLTAAYHGVTYEFASKENQAAFQANPEKYIPQYGGFCAFAVSKGAKADIDPHAFAIHDGKLYVNASGRAQKLFVEDVKGNIEKADHNWPEVAKQSKIIR